MKKLILFLLTIQLCTIGWANEGNVPLKLTIKIDKESYVPGDKIVLKGEIINISDKEVTFYKNGELNDLSISIVPIEKNIHSSKEGRFQSAKYFNPSIIKLTPSEVLACTIELNLRKENTQFNFACVEWEDGDSPYKQKTRKCTRETFEEDSRFTISYYDYTKYNHKFVLAPIEGKYHLQATFETDMSASNFMAEEKEEETPQNLTDGRIIESNAVEFTIFE